MGRIEIIYHLTSRVIYSKNNERILKLNDWILKAFLNGSQRFLLILGVIDLYYTEQLHEKALRYGE
jgi:hypothetical protein